MLATGIIFADTNHESIAELTKRRTVASIPFGGRYRLVDFALSNLVNSNIIKVGIITKRNYQSLMDHIGSAKDWDLSRRNGGVLIFPPFGNYKNESLYENRLEALQSVMGFINKCQEEYIVLMDCDSINIIDFDKALKEHIERKADLTIFYKKGVVTPDLKGYMNLKLDKDERIVEATLTSKHLSTNEEANTSINVWIINRKLLHNLITDAIAKGSKSFRQDIIINNIKNLRIYGHIYDGVYMHINSLATYYATNMQLLDKKIQDQMFCQKNFPIYTKVRDSAPTKYGETAKVINSYIADGCIIEGKVENSILFRGVKVGKNTKISNSILMQDTIIGENASLDCVVTDKNVTVRDRQKLSGCESVPYYLGKNVMI